MHSRTLATAALCSLLLLSASASAVDRPPGPDEPSPSAIASFESQTESARIGTPGWLQVEFAYRALVNALRDDWGDELTMHQGELLLDYSFTRKFQLGAGWHMFAHAPADFGGQSGVGDPYLRGKLSLPLAAGQRPQALAVVMETRFGIGQEVASQDGFTLLALGAYTVQLGDLEIDANAGVQINSASEPYAFAIPLGVRGAYRLSGWLRAYAEFNETLVLDALRGSQTSIGAGLSAEVTPRVVVHVGGGAGLTEGLPSGIFQFGVAFQAAHRSEFEMDYGP